MSSDRKIKVLTISTSNLAQKEGISTVILDYYARLDKSKFDLHITVSGKYSPELVRDFQDTGVAVQYLPSRNSDPWEYYKSFMKLCKKERYDVIYIHGSSAIMAIEFCIAKWFGCRGRIAHSHNTTCNHKTADRLLRPIFYRVITNAFACGKDAGEWLYGDRPFVVIRNGRDPNRYQFNEAIRVKVRKQFEMDDACIAVGHVGTFNEQKNQKYLAEVFYEVKRQYPNSKLFLMGDGRKKEEVEQYAQVAGLTKDIIFTGNISCVPDMLQAMDVMVLPSLHEGLPLVAVEWQMAGLPCILSDKITDECAFTDLVSFKSLDEPKENWTEAIVRAVKTDRALQSRKAVEASGKAGFDLNREASVLDELLSREVRNANV